MNLFNRIVLTVLCVILVIAAISIITLTWTIPNRTINWLTDAVQWINDNDGDLEKALLTTVSAFIGLVALIVLLIELIPRRGPAVRVTDLESGSATLSAAAISQRIEEAVVHVPHVSEVRAEVKSRRKGVLVSLDLHVDPDANLATVTDQACRVAQEVLTDRVHVALVRPPTARLHYRELRLQRGEARAGRAAARPAEPAPSEPAPSGDAAAQEPAPASTATATADIPDAAEEAPETKADTESTRQEGGPEPVPETEEEKKT